MFEKDECYRKAIQEGKNKITKVIKVWSGREEAIHDGGFEQGAEFGYNKAKTEQLEYAKTIIQDLLDNSDEYARERAMDFLKEN